MKKRKHSVTEFFYDTSFEDYQPVKESKLKEIWYKREIRIIKQRLDVPYLFKFFFLFNFFFYIVTDHQNSLIKFGLLNSILLAFVISAYIELRRKGRI